MTTVELIYDASCPNVKEARSRLIRAFVRTGVSARWREWERHSPDSPDYVRGYGSPTILINGRDVQDAMSSVEADSCRIYWDESGTLQSAPPVELIATALSRTSQSVLSDDAMMVTRGGRWQGMLAALPAIGTALLPKLACPVCWPAYTALLGVIGLGFMDYTPYLLPITAIFLLAVLALLWSQCRRNGHFLPFFIGAAASLAMLIGKFVLVQDAWTYGGAGLLFAAALLPSRRRSAAAVSCPACAPAGDGLENRSSRGDTYGLKTKN